MRQFGCAVVFVDGKYAGQLPDGVDVPPSVIRHRPDVMGIAEGCRICIGDAKTTSDLSSPRTAEQLLDFTSLELNGQLCEVFLGVPSDGKERLQRMLRKLGLTDCSNLHVLYVPEEIMGG